MPRVRARPPSTHDQRPVAEVILQDFVTLYADDKAEDAAQAFERYDLVSAAVIDQSGKLLGRVTVDAVVDYIEQAGLYR